MAAGLDPEPALPALRSLADSLLAGIEIPPLGLVRQRLDPPRLNDIEGATRAAVGRAIEGQAPKTVAIGVGSRGIANLQAIVRTTVATFRAAGWDPFIVPAMGSHGAADAAGQAAVLAGYGIDEAGVGTRVEATMETVVVGEAAGIPVHVDRNAHEAGAIFLVARVKPHTSFHGPVESGPTKMCAIGLGKQAGAGIMHAAGIAGLRDRIRPAARLLHQRGLLVGALGIVENQRDQTALIEGLTGAEVGAAAEERLLEQARRLMPKLPFDELDVLIIDQMGKDVSGSGMDTNVINRMRLIGEEEPPGLHVTAIVACDLSDGAHGNAMGIGLADFIPARLLAKVDLAALYANGLTAGLVGVERVQLPIILPTCRDAIRAAVATCGKDPGSPLKLAWIRDTLHTETLGASPALLEEARRREDLEIVAGARPLPFDESGELPRLEAALTLPLG